MLQRRVDTLTKERMGWGGGWGDMGWGGGAWGGMSGWGGGGSGWGGHSSYQQMEQLAVETERQCAEELQALADWRLLEQWKPPRAQWPESPATFALPPKRPTQLLRVSDYACSSRDMAPIESCPAVKFTSAVAAFNASCPISLCDFEE